MIKRRLTGLTLFLVLTRATTSGLAEEPHVRVSDAASESTGTASVTDFGVHDGSVDEFGLRCHLSIDLRKLWINRGETLFLKPIP